MTRVGIIGTGMLGSAVGMHLLDSGFELTAYNRTKSKTIELTKKGARTVDFPKDVAQSSDIVITIVKNADAVKDVSFGNNGIVEGRHDGLVVADMSTINPVESKIIAKKFLEHGITMLDIPVMGGPNVAINGKLVMMISGDKTIFEKYRKVFDTISNQVFFLGEVGTAHAVKLAMNIQIALLALAISEGITLARGANVDPEIFLKILNSTYFKTGMSENKAYKMIKGSFEPTFTLTNLKKDLDTINEAAKAFGVNLPISAKANEIFQKAVDSGFGDLDYTAILAYIKQLKQK
jgi:3-hydroxyisobutyrate dehydrogenase